MRYTDYFDKARCIAHSLDMSTMTIVARASRNRGGLISMELNCLYRTMRDVVNSILQRTIPRIHSLERISARSPCSFLRASRLRCYLVLNISFNAQQSRLKGKIDTSVYYRTSWLVCGARGNISVSSCAADIISD